MRRVLAYTTGWLVTLSWVAFLAACATVIGNLIKFAILVYYPDNTKIGSQWFPTILALVFLIIAATFNIYAAKKFPLIEGIMLCIHLAGWAGVVVTLWVTSPRGNTQDVIFGFINPGGWPNSGVAALIGVLTPWSGLVGYDSSVHMSIELPLSFYRSLVLISRSRKCQRRIPHDPDISTVSLHSQHCFGIHHRYYDVLLRWRCQRRPRGSFAFRSGLLELHEK